MIMLTACRTYVDSWVSGLHDACCSCGWREHGFRSSALAQIAGLCHEVDPV